MTAQDSGVPTVVSSASAAWERRLVRRATQLCLRAEPHAEESPCRAHLAEARRQLVGEIG